MKNRKIPAGTSFFYVLFLCVLEIPDTVNNAAFIKRSGVRSVGV